MKKQICDMKKKFQHDKHELSACLWFADCPLPTCIVVFGLISDAFFMSKQIIVHTFYCYKLEVFELLMA